MPITGFPTAGSSPRLWGTPVRTRHRPRSRRFIPTPVGNTCSSSTRYSCKPVHPHACGEHGAGQKSHRFDGGSSPRLWGTRARCRCAAVCVRFIPTPVGNTARAPALGRRSPVHPHACGEHLAHAIHVQHAIGSSPRLWGTPAKVELSTLQIRFIPTPVGNTTRWQVHGLTLAVHPHACGEHHKRHRYGQRADGSSPRLWGTRNPMGCVYLLASVHPHACGEHEAQHGPLKVSQRFIPTPVGNTATRPAARAASTVHPHACGEHRGFLHGDEVELRFIPTPVGNTFSSRCKAESASVHPHACGEHQYNAMTSYSEVRFIPTPVGNTTVSCVSVTRMAVHPHACGEHRTETPHGFAANGSSPRLWGTRNALCQG